MTGKVVIEIDTELERRANEIAAQQGRTLEEVIVAALQGLVEEAEQPRMIEIDPIFKMAGKFSGSSEDVSSRVRDILRTDVDPEKGFSLGHDGAS